MHVSQTNLIKLAAGELPPAETREAERHVASCATCRQALAAQRRVHALLGEWTASASPRDAWPAIEQALDDRSAIRPAFSWTNRLSRIAAVIVLGAGTGYGAGWLAKPHADRTTADRPAVSAEDALAAVGFEAIESPSATGLFGVMTLETEVPQHQGITP